MHKFLEQGPAPLPGTTPGCAHPPPLGPGLCASVDAPTPVPLSLERQETRGPGLRMLAGLCHCHFCSEWESRSWQLLVPRGTIMSTRDSGPRELACSPEERAEGRGEARKDSKRERKIDGEKEKRGRTGEERWAKTGQVGKGAMIGK